MHHTTDKCIYDIFVYCKRHLIYVDLYLLLLPQQREWLTWQSRAGQKLSVEKELATEYNLPLRWEKMLYDLIIKLSAIGEQVPTCWTIMGVTTLSYNTHRSGAALSSQRSYITWQSAPDSSNCQGWSWWQGYQLMKTKLSWLPLWKNWLLQTLFSAPMQ